MRKKERTTDFLVTNLPANRFKQFFDILKIRFSTLFSLGLILFLFFIPCLALLIFKDIFFTSLANSFSGEEYENMKIVAQIGYGVFLIIGLMVFSIGLSGSFRILREIIWGEPVFFKDDFFFGIKQNAKQFLGISLIIGLANLIVLIIESTLGTFDLWISFPSAIMWVLVFPALFISYFVSSIYSNNLGKLIRKSYLLYFRSFLSTFISILAVFSFTLLDYVPNAIIKTFVFAFLIIVLFPIALLGFFENEIRVFDKYINQESYKEIYHKGLNDYTN